MINTRKVPDHLVFLGNFIKTYLAHDITAPTDAAEVSQMEDTVPPNGSDYSSELEEREGKNPSTDDGQMMGLLTKAQVGIQVVLKQLRENRGEGGMDLLPQLEQVSQWIRVAQ